MSRLTLASLVFVLGCGGGSGLSGVSVAPVQDASEPPSPFPEGYVAPASTKHLPLEDHPEYVNWSRFPVGITAVRKKEVSNDFGTVRVATTLRLAEKTVDKVVVESQVTVTRSGENPVENSPQTFVYPAKFRLPEALTRDQFWLPSLKARHTGDEIRQACGREFNTQLFTWEERNETGPMAVKLWRSDDIPGRMLRQEINGHMHHSVEEVVEIRQPAEASGPAS